MRLLLVAVVSLVASVASAQPSPSARPARPRPVLSPEVAPDRRVTFRLRAPAAKAVEVSGQFAPKSLKLTRDEATDLWTATVDAVAPGVYEYAFVVDGLRIVDPANPQVKPQRWPGTSILDVPGDPPLVTEFQDVPHGTVSVHHYRAKTLGGKLRRLHLYTPPGYERGREKLPVLFLGHGYSDTDATWTVHGRAHWILDNLIAAGKARPMIVVMMDGHPVAPEQQERMEPFDDNVTAWRNELIGDVLPWLERTHRVRTDADGRAIVGLSMGGQQSLTTGLLHAEKFGWVGSFSGAAPAEAAIASALVDPKALARRLRWLWIGCGKQDFLLARNEAFVKLLGERGVPHTWRLTDGGHSWPVWREYLAEVLPQLFRAAGRR